MNYSKIYRADAANGLGFRVSLFVSGCSRNCPGCFNKQAQDPAFGMPFDDAAREKVFSELENDWCAGLSILGGEPMSVLSDNRKQVISFAKDVKKRFPGKDIWMWSGYTMNELLADGSTSEIFQYIDVLVDGPFVVGEKDLSVPFRGSRNQRVIDIAAWRVNGEVSELKFAS